MLGESSRLSTLLGSGKQCPQWRCMASDAPVPGLLGTSPGLARAALPQWQSTTGHSQQLGSPQAVFSPSVKASRPWDNGPQSIVGCGTQAVLRAECGLPGEGVARETLPCEMKVGGTGTDSTSLGHEPTSRRLLNTSFLQGGLYPQLCHCWVSCQGTTSVGHSC